MLKIAAGINFLISLVHLVSLFFSKDAFKYVGIEKKMNDIAAIHFSLPFIMTIGVAVVFFIFGLYALSADGVIRRLPLLKFGIYSIGIVFPVRGIMGFWGNIFAPDASQNSQIMFSIVAIIVGLLYLIGGYTKL